MKIFRSNLLGLSLSPLIFVENIMAVIIQGSNKWSGKSYGVVPEKPKVSCRELRPPQSDAGVLTDLVDRINKEGSKRRAVETNTAADLRQVALALLCPWLQEVRRYPPPRDRDPILVGIRHFPQLHRLLPGRVPCAPVLPYLCYVHGACGRT